MGALPAGFRDECASLVMPLDSAQPDGPTVPVFVSRAKSFTQPSRADLWLLQGGPGLSADVFSTLVDQLRVALPGFDIYTMEHRGVGQSARLGCPDQESPTSDQGTDISLAEVPGCLAEVQATWHDGLRHFRLTDAAGDLARAIDRTRTPGRPVFVYGVSYGSAVAIRYMQLRPDDAAGVILDSVAPPGIQFFSRFSEQYDPVLRALADLCAADPACVAHLGADPWSTLSGVTNAVAAGSCPGPGLTRANLSAYVDSLLERDDARVVGMALLHRMARCSPADVTAVDLLRNAAFSMSSSPSGRASQVLYWNVVLSDLWESPAPSVDELTARCAALSLCDEGSVAIGKVGALWPALPPDPLNAARGITTSSAVLILNGTLDPQTPIDGAMAFASTVSSPHETFVALPYSAHDTLVQARVTNPDQPPCGYQILLSFLADPTSAPDTSCVASARPVSFAPDPELAEEWFGASDLWDDPAPADAGAE